MATCVMRARCLTVANAMFTPPMVHLGRGSAPWSPCAASTSSSRQLSHTAHMPEQQHGHLVAPVQSSWLLGRSRTVRCMASSTEEAETVQVEISIPDMMCGGCTSRVEKALLGMDKVKKVDVSLETKIATVEVEAPTQFDALAVLSKLVDGVSAIGFAATPHIE